jgi:hypothetical protein
MTGGVGQVMVECLPSMRPSAQSPVCMKNKVKASKSTKEIKQIHKIIPINLS